LRPLRKEGRAISIDQDHKPRLLKPLSSVIVLVTGSEQLESWLIDYCLSQVFPVKLSDVVV